MSSPTPRITHLDDLITSDIHVHTGNPNPNPDPNPNPNPNPYPDPGEYKTPISEWRHPDMQPQGVQMGYASNYPRSSLHNNT